MNSDSTTHTTFPIPPKVLRRQREATEMLLTLAAGAFVVCRGDDLQADWRQACEEDAWRDIERMWRENE